MEFTTPKSDLLALLTRAAPIAASKSAQPILSCVLLEASDASLVVSASDLMSSITGRAPAEVKTPGILALPARDLLERIRALPEGPIVLSGDAGSVTLKAPGSSRRFKLPAAPADDYPPIPTPDGDAHEIPTATLADLIDHVSHAISTDETRAHINSMLVEHEAGVLRAVATDGHRLAMREVDCEGKVPTLLIPLKAVREVRKLCEVGEVFAVRESKGSAFFEVGGVTFGTRLTASTFPPWRQVVPTKWPSTFRVGGAQLADAIRAVSLASDDKSGQRVALDVGRDRVRLSASGADRGEATDEVSGELDGPAVKIAASAAYLLDAIKAAGGEDVAIGMAGEVDPIVVKAVGDGTKSVQVVMPMR